MPTNFDTTLSTLGINRTTTTPTATAAGSQSLGQNDFLKLMTAQLKNQDPFDPVDNTQMVAQMAQFSSLAGITEMSTTLRSIADRLGGTSASDALAYVGHTVLTEGNVALGRTTGGIAGAAELAGAATAVTVTIESADGEVLRTIDLGPSNAGTIEFDWDGTDSAGEATGPGPFTVRTSARNGAASVATNTLVWAPVVSVSVPPGGGVAQLTLPGIGSVPVTAVRQVG